MKKIKIVLSILVIIFCFSFFGCKKKEEPKPIEEPIEYDLFFNKSNVNLIVGESFTFDIITNYEGELEFELSNSNCSLDGYTIKALAPGTTKLYVRFEANDEYYSAKMEINITDLYLEGGNEFSMFLDEKNKLFIDTNYKGELDFVYDYDKLNITYEEGNYYVVGNETGTYKVRCYVPGFMDEYSTEFLIHCTKICKLVIDDVSYNIYWGTKLVDTLQHLFGDALSEPPLGYSLIGYFYDNNYENEVDINKNVYEDIEIYALYDKLQYTISLNKVVRYKSTSTLGQNCIAITQVAGYEFEDFDLTDYATYEVRYDISKNEYVIKNEKARFIPYDGFILGIKRDSDQFEELRSVLKKDLVLYLNSYNIIATTKIFINKVDRPYIYESFDLNLNCKYVSVFDVTSNLTVFEKEGNHKAYPASTTKMITVMTALRYCSLNDAYKIGDELDLCYEGPTPSVAGLSKGEIWSLRDLLYAVMLPSGNDAAYSVGALTINSLFPDSKDSMRKKMDLFASLMNDVAKDCGATNSSFRVPDGNSYYKADGSWDDRLTYHYVTANDMVKIACYAMSYSAIAEVVRTSYYRCEVNGKAYSFSNTNSFINEGSGYYYPGVVGLKTGYTGAAGRCLICACYKKDRFVIIAAMNASSGDSRNIDVRNILNKVYK